jgi:hypothetical protein
MYPASHWVTTQQIYTIIRICNIPIPTILKRIDLITISHVPTSRVPLNSLSWENSNILIPLLRIKNLINAHAINMKYS